MDEIIYILKNAAIPDYVKIGKTSKGLLEKRVKDLSRPTGVPLPFELFYACKLPEDKNAEKFIHEHYDKYRVPSNKEFFAVSADEVRAVLDFAGGQEISLKEDVVKVTDTEERDINQAERRNEKRKRTTFRMLEIQPGSILTFTGDDGKKVKVIDGINQVETEGGEIMTISAAALKFLHEKGGRSPSAHGAAYFEYEREKLTDRRNRIEKRDTL